MWWVGERWWNDADKKRKGRAARKSRVIELYSPQSPHDLVWE